MQLYFGLFFSNVFYILVSLKTLIGNAVLFMNCLLDVYKRLLIFFGLYRFFGFIFIVFGLSVGIIFYS